MAYRPTPRNDRLRLIAFGLVALCIVLRAVGWLDDVALATGCTAAAGLSR